MALIPPSGFPDWQSGPLGVGATLWDQRGQLWHNGTVASGWFDISAWGGVLVKLTPQAGAAGYVVGVSFRADPANAFTISSTSAIATGTTEVLVQSPVLAQWCNITVVVAGAPPGGVNVDCIAYALLVSSFPVAALNAGQIIAQANTPVAAGATSVITPARWTPGHYYFTLVTDAAVWQATLTSRDQVGNEAIRYGTFDSTRGQVYVPIPIVLAEYPPELRFVNGDGAIRHYWATLLCPPH